MKIHLKNSGRRFNKEWIFKNVSLSISPNEKIAVLGANGSGKSTFLQMISGFLIPSEGSVEFEENGATIESDSIYTKISLASPSLELFEDLTLEETIRYHFQLKNMISGVEMTQLPQQWQLDGSEKKLIRHFSSGMKQRVKLGLAFYSDTPVLLLDEPTTNLDAVGIEWYKKMVSRSDNRIVLVASNKITDEYFFCERIIKMEDYK